MTLRAFGAGIVLPLVVFASFLLWQAARGEHERYEQDARLAAQRIAASVDLELSRMQVAAEALATSPHIRSGEFGAFQQQASDAIRAWSRTGAEGFAFVLRDRSGQQVANTRVPWGAPLPKGAMPDIDGQVLETGRAVFQGLFVGASAGRPIVSIRVPAFGEAGEVTHVLSMAVDPTRIAEIIAAQQLPAGWFGAVVDQNSTVVARHPDHGRFVGSRAPQEYLRTVERGDPIWRGANLDGLPILGASERLVTAPWRTAVGVPLALVEAPLHRWRWLVAVLGLLSLGASVLMAVPFARLITGSVEELERSARAVGRGELVPSPRARVAELDAVGRAIAGAAVELREREAALRASEGRLRATHENEGVGIAEIDAEGRILSVNDAECRIVGHAREALLGRHFLDATFPEDYARDLDLYQRQAAGEFDLYNIEKRFVRADGKVGWARISSTAVRGKDGALLYTVRLVEDVTSRRQAEIRQTLLIDELNHRVKNTLATVQSLAAQTFRPGLPPDVARSRFEARLMALSRTHNLLNETRWTAAPLSRILSLELAPYRGERDDRVVLSGPELDLDAKSAVVLGMVVHELATNAAKAGALSNADGTVSVSWSAAPIIGGTQVTLHWRERGGPPVVAPARRGFGTRLIEHAIRGELAGELCQDFARDGLTCTLSFALEGAQDGAGMVRAAAE